MRTAVVAMSFPVFALLFSLISGILHDTSKPIHFEEQRKDG